MGAIDAAVTYIIVAGCVLGSVVAGTLLWAELIRYRASKEDERG